MDELVHSNHRPASYEFKVYHYKFKLQYQLIRGFNQEPSEYCNPAVAGKWMGAIKYLRPKWWENKREFGVNKASCFVPVWPIYFQLLHPDETDATRPIRPGSVPGPPRSASVRRLHPMYQHVPLQLLLWVNFSGANLSDNELQSNESNRQTTLHIAFNKVLFSHFRFKLFFFFFKFWFVSLFRWSDGFLFWSALQKNVWDFSHFFK